MASWFWRLDLRRQFADSSLAALPPADQHELTEMHENYQAWSSSTIKEAREGLGHHHAPQILLQLESRRPVNPQRSQSSLLILAPGWLRPPTSYLRVHFSSARGYCLTFAAGLS